MAWARIDDAFDDHPKVLAVLEHEQGGAAIGLWTLCLTWAHRNTLRRGKTPGLLPASLPRRYLGPGARELAALLVKEGLWEPLSEDDGWQIHDFDLYLPTEKTSQARSAAGKKGAASRWAKAAGRDSKLPSGDGNELDPSHDVDGKPMAADGKTPPAHPSGHLRTEREADGGLADSNEPSGDGNLPSASHEAMANDGSRAPARRVQVVGSTGSTPEPDIPVPPSAGVAASAGDLNPAPIVAAFIEGATAAGLKRPAANIVARVGKQARQLLAERTYTADELIAAARTMGAGEWNDLAVQARKDDAAANGRTPAVVDRRQQATDQKFERALARARAKDAQEGRQ